MFPFLTASGLDRLYPVAFVVLTMLSFIVASLPISVFGPVLPCLVFSLVWSLALIGLLFSLVWSLALYGLCPSLIPGLA